MRKQDQTNEYPFISDGKWDEGQGYFEYLYAITYENRVSNKLTEFRRCLEHIIMMYYHRQNIEFPRPLKNNNEDSLVSRIAYLTPSGFDSKKAKNNFKASDKDHIPSSLYNGDSITKLRQIVNVHTHIGADNTITESEIEKYQIILEKVISWHGSKYNIDINNYKVTLFRKYKKDDEKIVPEIVEPSGANPVHVENPPTQKPTSYIWAKIVIGISALIIVGYLLNQNRNKTTTLISVSEPIDSSNQPGKTHDTIVVINPTIGNSNSNPPRKGSESSIFKEITGKQPEENTRQIVNQNNTANDEKVSTNSNQLNHETNNINFSSLTNTVSPKTDMAILIVDNKNQVVDMLSSGIADIFKNHSVSQSLFTDDLLSNSKYLNGLINVNTQFISNLNLPSNIKYLIVGKYSKSFRAGTEYSKVVCDASLTIKVFDCDSRSVKTYPLTTSSGHDDEQHAEKYAIQNLLRDLSKQLNL